MTYAINPSVAEKMMELCHEGNFVFEVLYRYRGSDTYYAYAQGPSAGEVEHRFIKEGAITAVARKLHRE